MFERLADFFVLSWEYITPFYIINTYEAGVVLRLGKYHRTVGAGLRWKWPLIEAVLSTNTAVTTMELRAQTLTTLDGKSIVISSIVKYRITDVKPYMLEIWDSVDVISDTTLGAIKEVVTATDYKNLTGVEKKVLRKVKKQVADFGVEVLNIVFADQGAIRSIRLISDSYESNEE
ncbi:hypothetical protein KA005_77335 [bacterium]|nr:hypothetical protein [bacterium]